MFFEILVKLLPLYFMIFFGYIAAKKLHVHRESIAKLLIYLLAPIIIFYGALKAEISFANLSFPVLFYLTGCVICISFYYLGKAIYKTDSTKNILAFASGTGNTGYFGLPVTGILLGNEAFNIAIIMLLGTILYENTLGFFITAKGNHTKTESLQRVLKLPGLYTFMLGLLLNYFHFQPGEVFEMTIQQIKGAYTFLGMGLVGMGLSSVTCKSFDFRFISLSFLSKFIIWPALAFGFIYLDNNFLHIYNHLIHKIFILMSIVPMGANVVAFATELKCHPEKASLAVLLSALLALIYIPLVAIYFF